MSLPARFLYDSLAGQRGILGKGGDVWDKLPKYEWRGAMQDHAVVFEGGT